LGILIAVTSLVAPAAGADDEKLPAQLAGTGSMMRESGKATTAPWSISITSQDEDGNLKGTMNWSGRPCQLSSVPFTGTYRNGVLDISAPATGARCGAWTITLTKASDAQLRLEGTARIHDSERPVAVTLRPR
jgi:hypothetical protein